MKRVLRTTLDQSGRASAPAAGASSPQAKASPSAVIVAGVKSLALDLTDRGQSVNASPGSRPSSPSPSSTYPPSPKVLDASTSLSKVFRDPRKSWIAPYRCSVGFLHLWRPVNSDAVTRSRAQLVAPPCKRWCPDVKEGILYCFTPVESCLLRVGSRESIYGQWIAFPFNQLAQWPVLEWTCSALEAGNLTIHMFTFVQVARARSPSRGHGFGELGGAEKMKDRRKFLQDIHKNLREQNDSIDGCVKFFDLSY